MTKSSSMTRARLPRLIGVLVVIPACVFGAGYSVVSSLAAPASPAPASLSHPASARSSSSARFAVPAAPVIVSGPSNPSADPSPKFTFSDANWPNISFACGLDSLPHLGCTLHAAIGGVEGQAQFSNLAQGNHCFYVLAVDLLHIQSLVTKFCWTIVAPQGFTVGGGPSAALYPGTSQPINLTFTNPNPDPITIPSGGIASRNITITSNAAGCASSNFTITQGLTTSVTIPARQSTPVSLSTLGVPQADWPVIQMIETHKNQDVCENAKLTLTYSRIEATG